MRLSRRPSRLLAHRRGGQCFHAGFTHLLVQLPQPQSDHLVAPALPVLAWHLAVGALLTVVPGAVAHQEARAARLDVRDQEQDITQKNKSEESRMQGQGGV